MTADVAIDGVSMQFGAARALDDVTLRVPQGGFTVLLGPSGCGKSTLLSIIGGFQIPTAGRVLIGGADMAGVVPARRPTTTMFQDYALFPHMNVADNVGFGPRMRGATLAARNARAAEMLALVGLEGASARRPHELSGGQRQRVALARALAASPQVLLLDEPLGALDLSLRRQMQTELKAIQARLGVTFIHVTHDQEEAMAIADRIVVMNAGRIEDQGPPDRVYLAPKSLFAASFMGEINLIPAEAMGADAHGLHVDSPLGPLTLPGAAMAPGARLTLGIRPEAFREPGTAALASGVLRDLTFFGQHHRALVEIGGALVTAHLPQTAPPVPGAPIALTLAPERIIVLPDARA
jgi:spermidine/putrescine transport system ATP-binding protein